MDETVIDAVYTWVDMNDKEWTNKFRSVTGRYPEYTRFKDYGELEFSIKLLLKNCLFIRNIYIVTDNQIPEWYDKEQYPNIFIVDHSTILDENCHRPTFKSSSIESYLYKIPDLSEYYLYLNDDTFIGNKCTIYDFIDRKTQLPIARFESATLNNQMKSLALNGKIYSRAISLTNSANCVFKAYRKHYNKKHIHQAVIMRKSMSELAWKLFPNELKKSVKYPTRKPQNDTISFTNLSMLLGIATGKMKSETDKYSIRLYKNYAFSTGGVQFLNNILRTRPQLFCINDINDVNYPYFKNFTINYLQDNTSQINETTSNNSIPKRPMSKHSMPKRLMPKRLIHNHPMSKHPMSKHPMPKRLIHNHSIFKHPNLM